MVRRLFSARWLALFWGGLSEAFCCGVVFAENFLAGSATGIRPELQFPKRLHC
jgi:hypothetical protein